MVVRENVAILGDNDAAANTVLIWPTGLARRIRLVLPLAEEAAQLGPSWPDRAAGFALEVTNTLTTLGATFLPQAQSLR